jgi:hypothetical protein
MQTPQRGEPPGPHRAERPERSHALTVVSTLVGGGLGVILAIAMLTAWRDIGVVATSAITAIGAMIGAAIGVVALEVKLRSK